ncbi:MAG: hypothetical protein JOZ57_18490 [Abitibacteriaceae bacterium]|nr:hypothetical protein [Abditibacteriaceae bacterium]
MTALEAGSWGPVLRRLQVPVPYYSGQVNYLPHENLFTNASLDWTASAASSQEGTRAPYNALTDGTRNRLQERIVYAAAWHLDEVLPNIPNPPSPNLALLSDKIVLDIWGGKFTDIARNLQNLHDYGITNCAVIIHDWQRSGYDNALPMHIPANANLGGDEGMKTLVATATHLGYRIGLHENYVDYYPNYDLFNPDDIALDSTGKRINAWYNPGTKIQSFAEKPNAILRLAATQSPEIQRRYNPNECFLDVHSSVPPWFHVDYRAGEAGAGTFKRVWDVHRQLWQYERQTHGGPVFGEGNRHWYWSGYLDGTEAQFGQGWPENQGMTAPLMVDFDLLKIHPLQFNHGMGYYERWWSHASWGNVPPLMVLDQYRMQEIAYGHAGFLGGATYSILPYAWLEHHLMTPVTARYATAKPTAIRYEVDGRWQDATAAAKANAWNRVQIAYNNGLTITANDRGEPLTVGGYTLPRFGWLAQGAGVTAYTAQRNGVVADYAETADSVFANARPAVDWSIGGTHRLRPQVAQFAPGTVADPTAARTFRVTYGWQVNEVVKENYSPFVHFVQRNDANNAEGIRFQQDHPLARPSSQWQAGETVSDGPYVIHIPDNVADGDYDWMIGLSSPNGGRVAMEGTNDGHGRVRLGVLHVRNAGKTLSFDPEPVTATVTPDLHHQHLNDAATVVDFGPIRTNGSVLVRREGREWVLQTLPRDRDFVLELSSQRFGKPQQVRSLDGTAQSVVPVTQGNYWRLPLNGARQYRWNQ